MFFVNFTSFEIAMPNKARFILHELTTQQPKWRPCHWFSWFSSSCKLLFVLKLNERNARSILRAESHPKNKESVFQTHSVILRATNYNGNLSSLTVQAGFHWFSKLGKWS